MSNSATSRPSLAPRNWPGWIGVGVIWLLGLLPRRLAAWLTERMGGLLFRIGGRRRKIAERNIERCFPEWDPGRREAVVREHFRSLGRMLAEIAWSWTRRNAFIDRIGELHGTEHIDAARKKGRGVLVVTSHNTCLEIGARIFAQQIPTSGIYRPLGNEVLEWYQNRCRTRYARSMLSKRNLRGAVRLLRGGGVLWYAPDQDFGLAQSLFAPFFGIQTATLLATHRLPRMTGCAVVMMFPRYDRSTRTYHVQLMPQLRDYPTDEPLADLTRINAIIEEQVRHSPADYWWIHRRFKTRPEGEPPFYD